MSFDPTMLGANFRFFDSTATGGVVSTLFLPANPYRVAVMLDSKLGTVPCRWTRPVSGFLNFSVIFSSAPIFFSLAQHGALVQQELWVGAGAVTIYAMEVLWQPDPMEG